MAVAVEEVEREGGGYQRLRAICAATVKRTQQTKHSICTVCSLSVGSPKKQCYILAFDFLREKLVGNNGKFPATQTPGEKTLER